ncbi:hypothetical protein JNL27_03120 [bacterium]|nr:hypothetical protein [bacterium]
MLKIFFLLVFSFFISFLNSCDSSHDFDYRLTAVDYSRATQINGKFDMKTDSTLEGSWSSQYDSGMLSGLIDSTHISIGLDNGSTDSGYNLDGNWDGDKFVGLVYEITIGAPILVGDFEATKK